MSCTFDRERDRSLMLCTVSGDSSRKNFTSLGNIMSQLCSILVADRAVFSAENTDLSSSSRGSSSGTIFFSVSVIVRVCHDQFSSFASSAGAASSAVASTAASSPFSSLRTIRYLRTLSMMRTCLSISAGAVGSASNSTKK